MTIQQICIVFLTFVLSTSFAQNREQRVRVGSKAFTEGYVLGEYLAQTLESDPGIQVERHLGLGGTGILIEALQKGEIDIYPEYTGTIAEAILKNPALENTNQFSSELDKLGLVMSPSLGFQNTYALAVDSAFAEKHNLRSISDLKHFAFPLRAVFSHEFFTRSDGYRGLLERYRFKLDGNIRALQHSLAFEAISRHQADLIDVYSTDAKIAKYHLRVLKDDLHYFPNYRAVFLSRKDFSARVPNAAGLLNQLFNHFSEEKMIHLNAAVDIDKKSVVEVVANDRHAGPSENGSFLNPAWAEIPFRTREHLTLVGLALLFSTLVGIPLGVLAARQAFVGQSILLASGIVQTIPSLALLCFLIPVFGIGIKPALVALCLYGLLPVVLNTFTGIRGIDQRLIDSARSQGLSSWNRLWLIELPLSSPSILAGVRTSAVIGIGTATLAALIGAGGYGVPIVTGLAINDFATILAGAIPAAVMALAAHGIFELLGKVLVPKGLRISLRQ